METVLSLLVGIGLSAACGFRVFVPLLMVSISAMSGHLVLAPGFEWLGSLPALIAFSVATCLEIAGYYVPWVDHLLDSVSTPAAVVAGTAVDRVAVIAMAMPRSQQRQRPTSRSRCQSTLPPPRPDLNWWSPLRGRRIWPLEQR